MFMAYPRNKSGARLYWLLIESTDSQMGADVVDCLDCP